MLEFFLWSTGTIWVLISAIMAVALHHPFAGKNRTEYFPLFYESMVIGWPVYLLAGFVGAAGVGLLILLVVVYRRVKGLP